MKEINYPGSNVFCMCTDLVRLSSYCSNGPEIYTYTVLGRNSCFKGSSIIVDRFVIVVYLLLDFIDSTEY